MKLNITKRINIIRKEKSEIKSIKVDNKNIIMAKNAWNIILSFIGGIFASIGAYSLVHPVLRLEMLTVFGQFLDEVGLML